MKKWLMIFLAAATLVACNTEESTETKEDKSKTETTEEQTNNTTQGNESEPVSEYPFPESTPVGESKILVSTPAGDSSEGNVPVLFASPEDILVQIGLDLENFLGDKQTFIYIDKIFQNTEQVGELTQTSLDLQEYTLAVGEHTVTAVQFENDDPEAGAVINFVEAKYEVKESK